jgi:hypothetical protein
MSSFKQFISEMLKACSDFQSTIDDTSAEGVKVVIRYSAR